MALDVAYALDQLIPAALYRGSLTANTEAAYDAITWLDGRTKPSWSEIIAVDEPTLPGFDRDFANFNRPPLHHGLDVAGDAEAVQLNGFFSDAQVEGADTQFAHRRLGEDIWQQYTYRGEVGEYLYMAYNSRTEGDYLVVSEGGRWGFDKPTDILDKHALFTGTGLDDAVVGGVYTHAFPRLYEIIISSMG